jgi:hypothetical protein
MFITRVLRFFTPCNTNTYVGPEINFCLRYKIKHRILRICIFAKFKSNSVRAINALAQHGAPLVALLFFSARRLEK